ncbi:flap endonuclease GEN [Lucilia sericata]|uniref:flap endonuclease GEN n=1 Tax=Lucilia sericata TaxID=13632 RepID=UPI0018A80BE0|nr:flap endonuclease GEN [Lucilia sericata]
MGVKDLWSILTPHAERKPISELRGKTVAIDLAGWVCESLNVVDYFVHPRHHLKNLFFRTCYLIWEEVTPVFVLEGVAPKLKSQVIEKRNEIQFRGVKPKEAPSSQSQTNAQKTSNSDKGRTRFNHVLKQCENLLLAMGIQCVQGPGEAEAYCAFLNLKGLVDGVISQDSDCFAYGAIRVYRNFSVSTQGALAAQGGAVDIYDMRNICSKMDFGQNKVIVMALLCGCDYCPDGIGGVGRDGVLKLFNKYKNDEILKRIRSWRLEDDKYTALEMRIDDKTICSNCGHLGRTQSHTKNGCGVCRTHRGCDESLWKEERLSIKAELAMRKKALADPKFPSEEIIEEFLKQPTDVPKLQLHWRQPNMVKFIKQVGHLLQWPEIYCFQKFFPILTRWQVLNAQRLKELPTAVMYVTPKEIIKKRVVKGIASLELLWQDEKGIFNGLIPDNQLQEFLADNPKGLQDLWSTVEPFDKLEIAYPLLVEAFLKSKEKPKKVTKKSAKTKLKLNEDQPLGSLENLNDLLEATNDIAKTLKPKKQTNKTKKVNSKQGLQMIDRFFKQRIDDALEEGKQKTPVKSGNKTVQQCSTPITTNIPSDLESDVDDEAFNMSDIVNGIVEKTNKSFTLTSHKGKQLRYEAMPQDFSFLLGETKPIATETEGYLDDFDLIREKRLLSNSFRKSTNINEKRMSLDDSFDVLVKMGNSRNSNLNDKKTQINRRVSTIIDRFKQKQRISLNVTNSSVEEQCVDDDKNVSYFFNNSLQQENDDVFERLMETSLAKKSGICDDDNDFVILSD